MNGLISDRDRADEAEKEVVRLQCVIADALKAMDEGCYGDTRRILKTGKAAAIKSSTLTLTKGGLA